MGGREGSAAIWLCRGSCSACMGREALVAGVGQRRPEDGVWPEKLGLSWSGGDAGPPWWAQDGRVAVGVD